MTHYVETMNGVELGKPLSGLGQGGVLDFVQNLIGGGAKVGSESFVQFQAIQAQREAARAKQRTAAAVGVAIAAALGLGLLAVALSKGKS